MTLWINLIGMAAQAAAVPAPPDPPEQREIIVEGRRHQDRYRLPPELRTLPAERDGRMAGSDPSLACHNVGPLGCGTKLMPILTVRGGQTIIGDEGEPR